jgi:hypothetical protein
MMRRLLLPLLAAFNLLVAAPAMAEQGATVLRDAALRSEPYSDAGIVTTLKAHTTLTILERRGGWYQTRTADRQRGWVRMSAIRLGELKAGGSSGVGATLRLLSTGRSGASGVTVATGIRGLDAADVANATPDHQAVSRLARFQASAAQAKAFAAQAKLKSRKLAYLTEQKDEGAGIPGLEDW